MTWRKALLWSAAAAALLAVAGVVAFKALVDPERLKETARARVKAATGRELHVESVSLAIFPAPSVRALKVALANPGWAREKNLVQVDEVNGNLELLPLLIGKVRVKSLYLEGVQVALEEAADGAVSWSFPREGNPASSSPTLFDLPEIRIRRASILHLAKGAKSEPWEVEEARVVAAPGNRNVVLEAKVLRYKQPLTIKAELADLSQLGVAGAASDGKLTLAWAQTRFEVNGRFPLERKLGGHELTVEGASKSLHDLFEFFGFDRGPTAPFAVKFASRDGEGRTTISDLALSLGALTVRGDVRITPGEGKPAFAARLTADRVEWLKTLVDAGGKLKPPRKDQEIYHADPVAWHALGLLGALRGTAELQVGSLKMGNGLELRKVRARATMGDGRLALEGVNAEMLGGSATGSFRFDAPKKTVQANLEGNGLLLERWFAERGSNLPFKGGPMALKASLALTGETFRDLAATVTGPLSIRMGGGSWGSKRAGEIEELMVSALAPRGASDLTVECVAVKLDFRNGRAEGRRLVGARSDVSQLLTSGHVDFRDETLDLRGRVQARKGVNLGLAALAGGVRISGKLARPAVGMDPDEKPALLARAAAAIASSGATLLGEALLDAASRDDACAAVFK